MATRSKAIEIGFVSVVAAAALAGCNSQAAYQNDYQQCVDRNNLVVDDAICQRGPVVGMPYYYHWWYSPRPYYAGDVIVGGYASPRPNFTSTRASSIQRGGFGSSAHGVAGE